MSSAQDLSILFGDFPFTVYIPKHFPPFKHGFDSHFEISNSHFLPRKPDLHAQVYPWPTLFIQEAPFRHGLRAQSSMSVSHRSPLNPGSHSHL